MTAVATNNVVMEGVIGCVCFFDYYKIEKIVGKNLTAREVIEDIINPCRTTLEPRTIEIEKELRHLEKGDTRIHLCDDSNKSNIINGISNEARGILAGIEKHLEEGTVDRLSKLPAPHVVERNRDFLINLVRTNKCWTLQYRHEDGNWYDWDEVGFYVQIK